MFRTWYEAAGLRPSRGGERQLSAHLQSVVPGRLAAARLKFGRALLACLWVGCVRRSAPRRAAWRPLQSACLLHRTSALIGRAVGGMSP